MHHIDYEVDMKVELQFLAIVIRVLNLLRNQLVPDAKEICLLSQVKALGQLVQELGRIHGYLILECWSQSSFLPLLGRWGLGILFLNGD